MRKLPLIAPLALALAAAGIAHAGPVSQPVSSAPGVTVTIGGDLIKDMEKLGERDVREQADDLAQTVSRALADSGALAGAQVNLVLTDLQPNRPTFEQAAARPGLSIFDSFSVGGATIEGEVVTADGQRLPVRYSRYSNDIRLARNYSTWQDADRAFERAAANIAAGRLVSR